MAKSSPIKTNFTAGELSPRLDGRTDIAKYDNGCEVLENFVIHPQGGAARRPGTKFIGEVKDSSKEHRLLPFQFNVEQTYAVEMGDQTARFVTNDGFLVRDERTAYSKDDFLSIGWGSPTFSDSTNRRPSFYTTVSWSDDGLKVYFVKYVEAKTGSTHTLNLAIRQYDCTEPFELTTADATTVVERDWDFEDRFAAGVANGERKFHSGMFFDRGAASDDAGARLYLWDGLPSVDYNTVMSGQGNTQVTIYQFDLTDSFDISSTTSGTATLQSDDFFRAGNNYHQPGTFKPIPIAGVAIRQPHEGVFVSSRAYTATTSSSDSEVIPTNDYINMNTDEHQGGAYIYFLVSHLATESEHKLLDGTECNPGGIIVASLNNTSNNPYQFDDLLNYSNRSDNQETFHVPDYYPETEGLSENVYTKFHGLQTRSVRDTLVANEDGNNYYDTYGGGTPLLGNGYMYDINASRHPTNGSQEHNNILQVALIGYTTNGGLSACSLIKLNENNYGAIDAPYNHEISTLHVSELSDAGIRYSASDPLCDWKGLHPHLSYDGTKIFYSDNLLHTTDTYNLATFLTLKNRYIGFYIDEAHTLLNISDLDSNPSYTHDYSDETNFITQPILQIVTPYSSSDLAKIRFAQSADVLYLVHPDYKPRQLIRYGATTWGLAEVGLIRGPMQDPVFDASTVTASARTGSVTLTASAGTFSTSDVGRLIKVHDGYAQITAVTSDLTATATVVENEDGREELMPSYTADTIRFNDGDPSATGLEHNDRIHDSSGNFLEQGFKTGMRISISGASNGANNQSGLLIVDVTEDTILISPSGDLTDASAGPDITIVGDLEADEEYRLGAFSETTGFPSQVSIYEQRLVFSNTFAQPQTLFFSQAGLFTDFTPGIESSDAITYTLGSNEVNFIQYMIAARLLILGTSGGEFVVSSGGLDEVISPTNIQIRRQSNYGSSEVFPVSIGSAVIFNQRGSRKLRELVYDFNTDSYYASDLTLLAEHITEGLLKEVAWQAQPDGILWARLGDGSMCAMTYRREEEVVAWHRHVIGGSGFVESVMSTPSETGEDDVYIIVKRTIDGATKRYIERITSIDVPDDVADGLYLDSHLTYSGSSTSSLSGLDHLEGETVSILGDGIVQASKTVSSGSITLDSAVTKACVGLPYSSTLKTMRVDSGGVEGTSQAKTKRIREVTTRFLDTVGAKIGPTESNLKSIDFGQSTTVKTPLFTGDKTIEFHGDYETDGFVVIKQDEPLPMTVLAIMPLLQTFDR